jgi:hypothetical protein
VYSPVQAADSDDFEIWPPFIFPPDGSVNIYVPLGDNIIIKTRWGACTPGLAQAWTNQNDLTLLVNGVSAFLLTETSRDFWSMPVGMPLGSPSPCVNGSDTGWWVFWDYSLGALDAGTYAIHWEGNINHPFLDGTDFDGDGKPDKLDGHHVSVDFNVIVTE